MLRRTGSHAARRLRRRARAAASSRRRSRDVPPGRSGPRRRRRQVSDITVARLGVAARGPLPVAVVNGWGGVGGRVGSRAALTPAVPRSGGLRMCLPAGRAAAGPVGVGALQAVPDRGGDGLGQGCPPPPGLLFASGGAAGRAPTAVFVAGCRAMSCHSCCPPRSLRSVSRPLRKRHCRSLGGTVRWFAVSRRGARAVFPCLPAHQPACSAGVGLG